MDSFEHDLWFGENLQPLIDSLAKLSGYELLDEEMLAILYGVEQTNVEEDRWYGYDFAGKEKVSVSLARGDGDGHVLLRFGCSKAFKPTIDALLHVFDAYRITNPHRLSR